MTEEERIEERKEAKEQIWNEHEEKAADRAALTTMIASAMGGYFGVQEKNKRKRKTKNDKGCGAKRIDTKTDGSSISSSDTRSSK